MQRQDEHSTLIVSAVELFFVELKKQFGRRHGAAAPEIRRLGQRPVDGQFYYSSRLVIGNQLIGFVHGLQTAVVEKAATAQESDGVTAECPSGGAIADRSLAGGF